MVATDTPCAPWPVDTSCWTNIEDLDAAFIDKWALVSTTILWRLSGRRWGLCEQVLRPCRRSCLDGYVTRLGTFGSRFIPYQFNGRWFNASVCGCGDNCSCTELCEVYLPGPIHEILDVTLDGEVLDPSTYRVDAPGFLTRQDGLCWPDCQDLAAPAGEEGTFVVRYNIGLEPDQSAVEANSELTFEFIKACVPECGDCKLPKRVTQVTRQNMAAQFIDPQEFLEDGRTGIYNVDLWLSSVNPDKRRGPLRIMSPDFRPPRKTIWEEPIS